MDDVLFNQCLYPEGCVGNCNAGATSSSYSVFPLWSSGLAMQMIVNDPGLP
jgi:hypothetical protein